MDMVEQPRTNRHFCLGVLTEHRPIAGVGGSKERTVVLNVFPLRKPRMGQAELRILTRRTYSGAPSWVTGSRASSR